MFSMKPFIITTIAISSLIVSAYAAAPKPFAATSNAESDMRVPIDEADWSVYMDAPKYHFALAREYLQKGEYSKASSELKLGNSFLIFQMNRLSSASKQIEDLSNGLSAGKNKDLNRLDTVTFNAFNIINNKYVMDSVEIDAPKVFEDAYHYHFEKAKLKFQENDHSGAAFEIRRAASFMRLKAAYAGHIAKADFDLTEIELKELASHVESGAVKEAKELDRVFQKAMLVFSKEKP